MDTKGVAVISGAFGAVGTAVGIRLAQEGYTVVALYNREPRAPVAQMLAAFGPGEHAAYRCNFGDSGALKNTLEEIISLYKKIDVGVHAAWPPVVRKKLLESSVQEFETQFESGARGSFIFLQTLAKHMRAKGSGTLVGITTAALESELYPGAMGAYVPAKFALYGLLKIFSQELAPAVRVHAVAPRFMPAGMNRDLPPRLVEFMQEQDPTQLTSPEATAEAIVRLLSDKTAAFSILA